MSNVFGKHGTGRLACGAARPQTSIARRREVVRASPVVRANTRKGEHTRALILETALALFRERGYDQTTMRLIAERANVALGHTYYYFRSKEHLVQAFYTQMNADHRRACAPLLEREADLKARLRGVVQARIGAMEPYHRFAATLFRSAADPQSPLSPFGA